MAAIASTPAGHPTDCAGAAGRTGPGPALTPEQAGQAVIDLVTAAGLDDNAYLLTAAGLRPLQ